MIGRGNYVQLNTTLPLETNIVNESDLVFALDRFNYDQSDIYTVAGQNTEYSYELSFIKWNTGNPRLRLVDVNVSPIPEFSSFTLLLGIFSSFLMFFRKKS